MPSRPLIVRLRNWVGDVVLGIPLLQRLEDAGYQLQLLGKGWARDLLAGHGWAVETLPATVRERSPGSWWQLLWDCLHRYLESDRLWLTTALEGH